MSTPNDFLLALLCTGVAMLGTLGLPLLILIEMCKYPRSINVWQIVGFLLSLSLGGYFTWAIINSFDWSSAWMLRSSPSS